MECGIFHLGVAVKLVLLREVYIFIYLMEMDEKRKLRIRLC